MPRLPKENASQVIMSLSLSEHEALLTIAGSLSDIATSLRDIAAHMPDHRPLETYLIKLDGTLEKMERNFTTLAQRAGESHKL